jgi:hypothetical protein
MKLFTIPLPNGGGELVGYEKPKRCACFFIDSDCNDRCDDWKSDTFLRDQKSFTLSEVTEEMAKEWGFNAMTPEECKGTGLILGFTAKEQLQAFIEYENFGSGDFLEFDNILLIFIKK